MNYEKLILISSVLFSLGLTACTDDDEELSSNEYEITVTNITNNQPLTPVAIILHEDDYQAWALGSAASDGLEVLAESGDTDMFIAEANANDDVISTTAGDSITTAGNSVTFTLTTDDDEDDLQLSLATMLANTNDAFSGVNNLDIGKLETGESITTLAKVFDAGTESNDELNIPGSGGEAFNSTRDDIDKITIHPGVVTSNDGLNTSLLDETQRWQNYAAKIVVRRTQ